MTVFVLRNVSGKVVSAFTVSHGSINHTIDFFQTESNLPPGATYPLSVGNRELAGSNKTLQVSLVIFGDGSAHGIQDQIDFVRGRRLGRLFETERVRALLEAQMSLSADGAGTKAVIGRLSELPQTASDALDSVQAVPIPGISIATIRGGSGKLLDGFLLGVRNARQDALWKVEQTLQSVRPTDELAALREMYRGLSARNQAFLANGKGALR